MAELIRCAKCFSLLKSSSPRWGLSYVADRFFSSKNLSRNHYEVLGVKPSASPKEIKAAFLTRSKKIHPDTNPNDPTNHDKFVRLNEAYSVLIKPLSRREYDLTLAHRLYFQQNLARNAGSHNSGSYPGPGTSGQQGQYSGQDQERVFWDETIWNMRDKSKDSHMADDEYYSIKGIRKMPNSYIVAGCFAIMGLGFLYFYAGYKYSSSKSEQIKLKQLEYHQNWKQARENAKKYGDEKTIERLASRIKKNKERYKGEAENRNQFDGGSREANAAVTPPKS